MCFYGCGKYYILSFLLFLSSGCGLDFHKRCALQLPNDCSRSRRQVSTSLSLFPPRRPRTHSLSKQAGGSLEEVRSDVSQSQRTAVCAGTLTTLTVHQISMSKPSSRPSSWAEPPVWLGIGYGEKCRAQVPHTFHIHSYTRPTMCQYCHRLLKGLFRQGLQCSGETGGAPTAQTESHLPKNAEVFKGLNCLKSLKILSIQ